MKVISDNLITAVVADSENANYPATNVLAGPIRPWKAATNTAQLVISCSANLSGFAMFATNAETFDWRLMDGASEIESGTETAPTRVYPETLRNPAPFWIEFASVQTASRTIEIDFATAAGSILEVGTVSAGYISEFPAPQWGLTRTIKNYSIRKTLKSGEKYSVELPSVTTFSGTIEIQDNTLYDLIYGFLMRLSTSATAVKLVTTDETYEKEWIVYGAFDGISGSHSQGFNTVSFTLEEAVSNYETAGTGGADMGQYDILTYDDTDSTPVILPIGALYKKIIIDRTVACTLRLPAISSDTIGGWIEISKVSTGTLTIETDSGDTIVTSLLSDADTIENLTAGTGCVYFVQITETQWELSRSPTGTWQVSN